MVKLNELSGLTSQVTSVGVPVLRSRVLIVMSFFWQSADKMMGVGDCVISTSLIFNGHSQSDKRCGEGWLIEPSSPHCVPICNAPSTGIELPVSPPSPGRPFPHEMTLKLMKLVTIQDLRPRVFMAGNDCKSVAKAWMLWGARRPPPGGEGMFFCKRWLPRRARWEAFCPCGPLCSLYF